MWKGAHCVWISYRTGWFQTRVCWEKHRKSPGSCTTNSTTVVTHPAGEGEHRRKYFIQFFILFDSPTINMHEFSIILLKTFKSCTPLFVNQRQLCLRLFWSTQSWAQTAWGGGDSVSFFCKSDLFAVDASLSICKKVLLDCFLQSFY